MSPKLYKVYSDELIQTIKRSQLGIAVGSKVVSIIMYADDLILIADTPENIQKQLDLVGKQGADDDVKFNAKDRLL